MPRAAYLVGGNVRDALLERPAEYLDLDFVLPQDAVKTARAIAQTYRAGFVLLDADRQIARVVFDHATVDFAQQVGNSLEEDLRRRDFTVNAIAYNPHTDQLVDPLQGYQDLQRKVIRMIAPENLKEDPLRLLRAYRQAAQLGFTLDPQTEQMIQQLSPLLSQIAAERIQGELNYLLNAPKGTLLLTRAWQDGLFDYWLAHATTESLARLGRMDEAAIALDQTWPQLGLHQAVGTRDPKSHGSTRSWLKVAKLASLVDPDPSIAESELWRLKYSRIEVQTVLALLRCLSAIQDTDLALLSLRQQYFFFRNIGSAFPALAIMALALGVEISVMAPLIDRFLHPEDPVAHPVPPLTGRDLMQDLQLSPGPQIGQLLEAIQLAQAEGRVQSRQDAIAFARQQLNSPNR
ncbi:MAG: CCA tRNA nucleotidyltransferase [Oculatellaceae cyanobacterium Prado106]|nr:CCA tRNA nucleotidyltransferase [Oculatellaceae cyanobacterium Prado106]